jgi:hypothetical protein
MNGMTQPRPTECIPDDTLPDDGLKRALQGVADPIETSRRFERLPQFVGFHERTNTRRARDEPSLRGLTWSTAAAN